MNLKEQAVSNMHTDVIDQFRKFIAQSLGTAPAKINADGKIHKFVTNGKPSDDAGRYVLHLDPIAAGWCRDWRTGQEYTWCLHGNYQRLTEGEREAIRQLIAEREAEKVKLQEEARQKARVLWDQAPAATNDHPYLIRKDIPSYGLRWCARDPYNRENCLIVPAYTIDGVLQSLQFISPALEHNKLWLEDSRVTGSFFRIGPKKMSDPLRIGEGYSTCARIHEVTDGATVIVAFGWTNL